MIVADGIRIAKIFLHITPAEQVRRFKDRLTNPLKRWKLSYEDFRNRSRWAEYEVAIEDMMQKTSHKWAPWYLIPANLVQLRQVTVNLIINGVEAMSTVVNRPKILRVKTAVHDSRHVLITVEDSGVGIDPKNVSCIFDPFFTTKSDGMGLGLSICRSIIENHGGRLSASPSQPHGSIFQIFLLIDGLESNVKKNEVPHWSSQN